MSANPTQSDMELCGECGQPLSVWQDSEAEVERLRQGIGEAAAVLDAAERDPTAAFKASLWLRTTYSFDHPNYLTPEQVRGLLDA